MGPKLSASRAGGRATGRSTAESGARGGRAGGARGLRGEGAAALRGAPLEDPARRQHKVEHEQGPVLYLHFHLCYCGAAVYPLHPLVV